MNSIQRWMVVSGMSAAMLAGWVHAEPQMERGWGKRPGPQGAEGMGAEASLEAEGLNSRWLENNPQVIQELGLKTEQLEALKNMRFEVQRKMIDLNASKERASLNQAELMSKENPDETAIMKSVDEVFESQKAIAKLRLQSLLKIRTVLSPEQRIKAKEMLKTQMKKHADRENAGGEPGEMMKKRMMERRTSGRGETGPGVNRDRTPEQPQLAPPPPPLPPQGVQE